MTKTFMVALMGATMLAGAATAENMAGMPMPQKPMAPCLKNGKPCPMQPGMGMPGKPAPMMKGMNSSQMGVMKGMNSSQMGVMKGMKAHPGMRGMPMAMAPKGDHSPSSMELAKANMEMHEGMDIVYTGNADADFLRGMIAHHQGAVDMAEVVLKYGKDAQVKRLAQDIIRAQNLEIRWMTNWLKQIDPQGPVPAPKPQTSKVGSDWMGNTWMGER